MTKSVITIEKTFLDFHGVPCIRRVIKEDDVVYYKDAVRVSDVFGLSPWKIDMFERWFDYIKHPENEPVYHNPPPKEMEHLIGSKITKDLFREDLQSYCESIGL